MDGQKNRSKFHNSYVFVIFLRNPGFCSPKLWNNIVFTGTCDELDTLENSRGLLGVLVVQLRQAFLEYLSRQRLQLLLVVLEDPGKETEVNIKSDDQYLR